ncbi:MAG: monofunctional biosynthetic peptidoglycan transglycosylase [Rhodobacteraceae bacterium]|nr:monofunctional biosynthetic peptidoglycan transglycosylase [Paracoccaceae bacterium]
MIMPFVRILGIFVILIFIGLLFLSILGVIFYKFNDPKTTRYMASEEDRLGKIKFEWVDFGEIKPVVFRSVIAAEDANFCLHWGFDLEEIRRVLRNGRSGGASTITQQVVKNLFLWHGRDWLRKGVEALYTPVVELIWTKRRISEIYLNIAEFDEGVFGIQAAAKHHFGTTSKNLTPKEAAALAAVLPSPKLRSAINPSSQLLKRAASIRDGAATIRKDGRDRCVVF